MAFFQVRIPEQLMAAFPIRFKEDSDLVVANAFFQELVDIGSSLKCARAPTCYWSPIPPAELRGESTRLICFNQLDLPEYSTKEQLQELIACNFFKPLISYVDTTGAEVLQSMLPWVTAATNRADIFDPALMRRKIEFPHQQI
ncbi:hypothetical protein LXL04_013523 [Taraxacum kok-saghyz]